MGADCCGVTPNENVPVAGWRTALWVALLVNAVMFAAEVYAGFTSGSVSLRADALDFLGDTANYTISLAVVGLALQWRARAALVKGITLVAFGGWVIVATILAALRGVPPEARVMGVVGFVALVANLGVAVMLYRFRSGDSNMQSVWICSRNDALGNIAVMLAALGVFGTGRVWPDLVVAVAIAGLALFGGIQVIRTSMRELRLPAGGA